MERSKSCLYAGGKQTKNSDIDEKYNKIQEKINNFNNKIATFDEEKKKLNLELTPTRVTHSDIKKELSKNSHNKSACKLAKASELSNQTYKSKNKLPEVEIVQSHRKSEVNMEEHEIIFP